MIKKIINIFILLFLISCAPQGASLVGPIFTGAITKSVAQTSLSLSTNQLFHKYQLKNKKKRPGTIILEFSK